MNKKTSLNIHAVIPCSRINGPGKRLVVFFQGCGRNCAGCFNHATHSFDTAALYQADEVFERHLTTGIEGLTISGGEPFLQAKGLAEILKIAKERRNLTTVVYTGFTLEELKNKIPSPEALEYADVLIDGPFVESKKEKTLLARGSSNQTFHFLSDAYSIEDFSMPGKIEINIGKDGVVVETGFSKLPAQ
ncbi:MAG: 4Fe-4S single cluster domain-containing protein [Thermodesulfobacteriota bacterium]